MSSCAAPSSGSAPAPATKSDTPAFPKAVGPGPRGMPAHACMGLNSCRASDRFGVAGPSDSAPSGGCGSGAGGSPTPPQPNGCGGPAAPAPSQPNGCSSPGGGGTPAPNGCGGPGGGGTPTPAQPNGCGGSGGGSGSAGAPNACAGQGYCSTATDHTCHVQNSCRDQGGCGLYGTDEELNRPGDNECRSRGSCATPINAERFSTNGPNQAKSVWLRARAVFEEKWPAMRAELLARQARGELDPNQPLPETLGPPPAPFAETGPTFRWIGDMTACGSSGMSGAGGCS